MADEWVTVTKQSRRYGKGKGKGGEGDHQHHPHPPAPAAAAAAEESQRSVASIQASLRQCRDTVQFSQLHADIAAAIVNNAGWGKGAHGSSSSSSSSGGGGAGGGGGAAVVGDATAASEVATGTTSEDGRSSLIRPKTIVCYGVGNFGHMPQARFQFAMLQVLATTLEVPPSDVYVYDPCFTRAELAVLAAAGHTAIGVNEECKRAVDSPTLFYMVHCGLDMYNNLLWANWKSSNLQNVVVLGNSFSGYEERSMGTALKEKARFVSDALKLLTETEIRNTFDPEVVFNDLALHAFHPATLKASASSASPTTADGEGSATSIWADTSEPPRMDGSELVVGP
eukprot:gene9886-14648_t